MKQENETTTSIPTLTISIEKAGIKEVMPSEFQESYEKDFGLSDSNLRSTLILKRMQQRNNIAPYGFLGCLLILWLIWVPPLGWIFLWWWFKKKRLKEKIECPWLRVETKVNYYFEKNIKSKFAKILVSIDELSSNSKIWRVRDKKKKEKEFKEFNLEELRFVFEGDNNCPIYLDLGSQSIYFMPDAIYEDHTENPRMVKYEDLDINVSNSRITLDNLSEVPSDSKVVDTTWEFANKDGSRDKRRKENKEIPTVLYENIDVSTKEGVKLFHIQISKGGKGIGERFAKSIESYAKVLKSKS